ncbi:MAG: AI-2E family transporter [Lachnospiraceae bacterium]|nr:AI-2E family transporter [Lachnospiraceae bacterium]
MKFPINKKYLKIGTVAFIVIALSILFAHMISTFDTIPNYFSNIIHVMQPIIFGVIFAYLFNPIMNFFERELIFPRIMKSKGVISDKSRKITRLCSVILTYLFIGLLIYGLISLVSPKLVESINILINQMPNYFQSLQNTYDKYSVMILEKYNKFEPTISTTLSFLGMTTESMKDWVNNVLPDIKDWFGGLSSGLRSIIVSLWNLIIGLVVSIYALLTKEKFSAQAKKIIYALFSKERANNLLKDTRFISDTFIGFISGKIFDSLIIGILCFIGLTILRIPYTVLISVIIGITNIIPFFGPFIGAIPSAFLLLMINPLICLKFIIFIVVLQQIDGNIIGPKILGSSTGLSGFWVIFAITVFGGLWSFVGMFIGIPFFAVIYALIKRKIDHKLEEKNMPTDTDFYGPVKRIEEDGTSVHLAEADDSYYLKDNDISLPKIKEGISESVNKVKNTFSKKKTDEEDTPSEEDNKE